ncbi:MAG: tRNA (N(6)-L-threonylcarbamoyladenosine(37)-C(2))-methylthiotransferase [Candidatus Micrarchaeota archaeon]
MGRIFIKTYGCTLNQSDSGLMEGLLLENGHELAKSEKEADAIIVNTCGVKETTENKILWHLGELSKSKKKVIVAGCLPAMNLQKVRGAIPNAIGFVGPNSINGIIRILEEGKSAKAAIASEFSDKFSLHPSIHPPVARIQISSGCLSNCTFCATKIARGKFQSKPAEMIVSEAKLAIQLRAKEIQLASQDNSCYGFDLKTDLTDLLQKLNELEGRFRIRVGMANPQHMLRNLDEWIAAFKLPKVYKFLHIPFQSGSNRILQGMQRGYSVEEASAAANEFRRKIPQITLETDMIVGFPGETSEEFGESMEICSALQFDVVNVSKYSKRKGTKSAGMRQMHSSLIKERAGQMNALVKEIALSQNRKYIGEEYDVLLLEKGKHGYLQGRNGNYKAVLVKERRPDNSKLEIGQFVKVKIADASVTSLIGETV